MLGYLMITSIRFLKKNIGRILTSWLNYHKTKNSIENTVNKNKADYENVTNQSRENYEAELARNR